MKLLIFFISIIFLVPKQSETYYIVKVKGDIVNTTTGKTLAQGDAIEASDELKFSDADAMALVISDSQSKYSLKFPNIDNTEYDEYISTVEKALTLTRKKRFATRGILTDAPLKDLKEFLGDNDFTVIGNSLEVKLSKQAFENLSIEAKYDKNGKPFKKELIIGDTILNLSRKELGAKSYGEVKIYHVDFFKLNEKDQSIEKITRLDLNFIDEYALRDELKTIINVYKKKDYTKPQMKTFLMEYFLDFYGNTHEYLLSQYVDKIIADNMK